MRNHSRVNRETYRIQRRLRKPLASVLRLRSVVALMGVDAMRGLRSTYSTGGILADGNGIQNVGSEMWR